MGVIGVIVVVQENLRLVYTAGYKPGQYGACGGAQYAECVGDLKIGQPIAACVLKAGLNVICKPPVAGVCFDPICAKVICNAYESVKLILVEI